MYTCAPTPAAFYNRENFFGYPTKTYSSVFNREAPTTTPYGCPVGFERTYPTTFTTYPWTFDRFERFGTFPWSNWTGFPTTTYPTFFPTSYSTFPGAFPRFENEWYNNFNNTTLSSTSFRPSAECEYFTIRNPIRCFEDGTRGLWLCFDLRGYKPEEVTVTVNKAERAIIVEGCHDVKEYNVMRKFYRKFVLPEYMSKVDITKIEFKSFFGPDGLFYVEGILPKPTIPEEYASWPAYPWTCSSWVNPAWCNMSSWSRWANNWWNNTPMNNTWTNKFSWDFKPVTCKLI